MFMAAYATSPAGYVSGALMPVAFGFCGAWYLATRTSRTTTKQAAETRIRKMEDAILELKTIVSQLHKERKGTRNAVRGQKRRR